VQEDEPLGELPGYDRIHRLLARELGQELADAFARTRRAQEAWEREQRPGEGLRERKKRITRQRISDVATTLFVVRGFEHVKVAEVAEIVGVSEKTVFNYFPTKEAMVFDEADEGVERLAAALREREPGESLTSAVVRALAQDLERHGAVADELTHFFMPSFAEMVAATPSLRAAWLDIQGRLVAVAVGELAAGAEVDPRDPEPMIAAWALVGLVDVSLEARVRRTEEGLRGAQWRAAVLADVERAARVLETGLWSFHLLTQGARTRQQLEDAAIASEQARAQVLDALGKARSAWRDLRKQEHEEIKRAARAAYESFRETLRERQQAVREQQAAFREQRATMRETERAARR
jgi:AcrR family transcriptional regulator